MVEMTEVRILKIDPDDLDSKTQQVVNKPAKIQHLQDLLNSGYNIVSCVISDDCYLYYTLIMKYDFDFD
jgi:hypothetical protein